MFPHPIVQSASESLIDLDMFIIHYSEPKPSPKSSLFILEILFSKWSELTH